MCTDDIRLNPAGKEDHPPRSGDGLTDGGCAAVMPGNIVSAVGRVMDGFFAVDRDWRLTYVNGAGEQFIGKRGEDVIGCTPWELFPEVTTRPFVDAVQRAGQSGEPLYFQVPSSPDSWFVLSVYPSPDGTAIVLRDVTALRRAEEAQRALRESEAQLRAVWEATSEAIALSNRDGTVLAANPAYLELYGYDESEAVGKSFAIIFPEEQRDWAEQQHRAVFSAPDLPQGYESRIRRKDGTERIVEARADFVVENGQRTAMISAVRDVTDRLSAETALRESEERLRLALDAARMGVYFWDPRTDRTNADARVLEMLGLDPNGEFSLATALNVYIHPDDRKRYTAAAQVLVDPTGSGELSEEIRWIGSDGNERWIAFTGKTFFEGEGADRRAVRAVGGAVDITTRKRAEEALRASEERFRTLIQRSTDGIQLIDPDGMILYSSDSVEAVLGYQPEDLIGQDIGHYVHPDDLTRVTALIGEIAATPGSVGALQYRIMHRSCSWAWVDTTLSNHLNTPSIGAIVGNFRNITEQKRAENEREAFVTSATHDLKSPLTSLTGQVQLLLRRVRREQVSPQKLESSLETIDDAARRMNSLIEEMMDSARLGAGHALDLNLAPTNLVALAQAAAEASRSGTMLHKIRVEADVPDLIGEWDHARLRRVLGNLLNNAVKYSPGRGDIVLRVGRQADTTGTWAVLSLQDEGVGIPAADLPYVFERFQRGGNVAGRIGGTGIGLSGAAVIVRQHGGGIAVDSTEGQGSIFTLRLPLSQTSSS